MSNKIRKIISGGQTGADRAALDFALENGFEIGGWIPKNRRAEDGRISEKYPNLIETEAENPDARTELNVRDSDATLILSHGELTGGSKLTFELTGKYRKPSMHIDFSKINVQPAVEKMRKWLESIDCQVLNVAGARATEDSQIYEKTKLFLAQLFA